MNKIALENYNRWLNSPVLSDADKKALKEMNENQIDDAFFKNIEFGTAGMRGILGPGTNRLNIYTIKKACVGFGLYILKHYKAPQSCAISHDNRYMSREFTLECAEILNEMGINTYIFDSLRPTPELSYAVRYKKCSGGIMITASHNPKEDNGYKVYDEEGCQLVPSKIKDLIDIIATLGDELNIVVPKGKEPGKNEILGKDVDDTYVELCKTVQINPDLDKRNFKIVYTPNHGTSYVNAMRVFKDCGYDVHPVLSQCDPDPAFSGTLSPNPENPDSYNEPIKLAKEIDADLICMTDPDGDRVGLACKNKKGDYTLITGNESAALLLDYIISEKLKKGEDLRDKVVYNTVVSSSLGEAICKHYGVKIESFLTGFKYIGDRIHYYELNKGPSFLFGFEESYGCLAKDFVRDKDGIQAILLYCEMALFYKLKGVSLDEAYNNLGRTYGYRKSKLYNIYFRGSEGQKEMQKIMDEVVKNPIYDLSGNKTKFIENYFELTRRNVDTNEVTKMENLPKGDLIKFIFEDESNISIRPSGTEPKCKFYIEMVDESLDVAERRCDAAYVELKKILKIN